jgi:hypothetical protein
MPLSIPARRSRLIKNQKWSRPRRLVIVAPFVTARERVEAKLPPFANKKSRDTAQVVMFAYYTAVSDIDPPELTRMP